MNEHPLTHTETRPTVTPPRKKTGMIALTIILALIAIASIGYSAYAWQQNQNLSSDITSKNNQIADLQKQKTTASSSSTSTNAATSTDPYAGWQSATLKYEKASFKYPSTWQLTNVATPNGITTNITPGSDQAKLVSPTGLTVTIDTGVSGIGDGPFGGTVLYKAPITTLGGDYYLGFGTDPSASSTTVYQGGVGTSSSNFLLSKNVSIVGGGQPYDVISMAYYDSKGDTIGKHVSDFQNDPSYNDALLIIKSLSY